MVAPVYKVSRSDRQVICSTFLCMVEVKNAEYVVDSNNRFHLPISAASDGSE